MFEYINELYWYWWYMAITTLKCVGIEKKLILEDKHIVAEIKAWMDLESKKLMYYTCLLSQHPLNT